MGYNISFWPLGMAKKLFLPTMRFDLYSRGRGIAKVSRMHVDILFCFLISNSKGIIIDKLCLIRL